MNQTFNYKSCEVIKSLQKLKVKTGLKTSEKLQDNSWKTMPQSFRLWNLRKFRCQDVKTFTFLQKILWGENRQGVLKGHKDKYTNQKLGATLDFSLVKI